jgi:hypothetical protein
MTNYNLNMNNQFINNCLDPVGLQDVATKSYLDKRAIAYNAEGQIQVAGPTTFLPTLLSVGANGDVLTVAGGVPTWAAGGGIGPYPVLVPIYRQLQPAPQTAVGITNGPPCELTAGGLSATIAEIYDPVAAAALGLSTVVQVEYWYSAGFANGSNQMIFPVFPNNLPVNDNTPGVGPISLFYAPKYIPSTTGTKTPYIGNQGCYSSSVLSEIPPNLAGERGFTSAVNNLQTQTSIIVAIDVAGFAPTDTIQFVLDAYTQYGTQVLDTTQPYPQVEYFGQISITTSMTRA